MWTRIDALTEISPAGPFIHLWQHNHTGILFFYYKYTDWSIWQEEYYFTTLYIYQNYSLWWISMLCIFTVQLHHNQIYHHDFKKLKKIQLSMETWRNSMSATQHGEPHDASFQKGRLVMEEVQMSSRFDVREACIGLAAAGGCAEVSRATTFC